MSIHIPVKKYLLTLLLCLHPFLGSAETTLRTAYQESVPKYIQQKGTVSGICFDIITELNKRLKQKEIRIACLLPDEKFLPWKRIQQYLQSGKLDIVVGMAKNKKRLQLYTFSNEALYSVHSTFAYLAETPFQYHSLPELEGKDIIAVRGTKTAKNLVDMQRIKTELTITPTTALKMLLAGRGDLVYYHDLGLAYIIQQNNWADKIHIGGNVFEYQHFIGYNKKVPLTIREQIDTELRAMKKDGTMDRILDTYR